MCSATHTSYFCCNAITYCAYSLITGAETPIHFSKLFIDVIAASNANTQMHTH